MSSSSSSSSSLLDYASSRPTTATSAPGGGSEVEVETEEDAIRTRAAAVTAKLEENHYASYVASILKYAKYRELEGSKRDIRKALKAFPGLKPVLETHFFNDGSEKPLVALSGTIPIFYKGNYYNIPLIVWLMDCHPYRSPKVFLQPTPEMRVRPSHFVNKDGKIRILWRKPWNQEPSSLRRMLRDLIILFENKPPLFSIW